jgi:hypothetical protein
MNDNKYDPPTQEELTREQYHCFTRKPTVDALCRCEDYINVWSHIEGAMERLFVEHRWRRE